MVGYMLLSDVLYCIAVFTWVKDLSLPNVGLQH